MPQKELFVERHGNEYVVLRPSQAKPIARARTQGAAAEKARKYDPDATVHIERVRNVGPGRDKWRS